MIQLIRDPILIFLFGFFVGATATASIVLLDRTVHRQEIFSFLKTLTTSLDKFVTEQEERAAK